MNENIQTQLPCFGYVELCCSSLICITNVGLKLPFNYDTISCSCGVFCRHFQPRRFRLKVFICFTANI